MPAFHRRLAIEIPAEAELYEKLKAYQWNASSEIDWSRPIRNFSEETWASAKQHFSREEFDRLCAERRAFTFTQLFLGEQAALAVCAQLVNMVPEAETRFCLAGQIIDEARHVEVFGRYLDKLGVEAPSTRRSKSSCIDCSNRTTTARRSSACRSFSKESRSVSSSASSAIAPIR